MKVWQRLILAMTFSFVTIAPQLVTQTAQAAAMPVFKTYNDISSGGWFDNADPNRNLATYPNTGCSSSDTNYQAPFYNPQTGTYFPSSSVYKGAILSYNYFNTGSGNYSGSATKVGALALGLIEGNGAAAYGFSTGPVASSKNDLSLSNATNSTPNFWGGLMAGTTPQTHCIPDYFFTKQLYPKPLNNGDNVFQQNSGQYMFTRTTPNTIFTLTRPGHIAKVAKYSNITFFVKGDVYIGADIDYPVTSTSGYKIPQTPHFALVVLGNIYVDAQVSRLDGLYIAQPDQTNASTIAQTGVFWTCHDSSTSTPTNSYLYNDCGVNDLVVNGAVIAKQVNLLRTDGNINDTKGAEIFNYDASMVLGGPFFNTSSSGNNVKIDSLVNLPPVF